MHPNEFEDNSDFVGTKIYLIYSIVRIVCQIEPRGSRLLLHLAAMRALIVIH